jgi:hypothetical protein
LRRAGEQRLDVARPAVDEVLAAGWRFADPPFDHELLIPMQKVVGSVSVQIAAF